MPEVTVYTFRSRGVPEMLKKLMVKLNDAFPARIAHPAVAKFGAGAGRLDHGPDQQVADGNSVREQDHRGDRLAEQGARREDQSSRRPYPEYVGQFGCEIA